MKVFYNVQVAFLNIQKKNIFEIFWMSTVIRTKLSWTSYKEMVEVNCCSLQNSSHPALKNYFCTAWSFEEKLTTVVESMRMIDFLLWLFYCIFINEIVKMKNDFLVRDSFQSHKRNLHGNQGGILSSPCESLRTTILAILITLDNAQKFHWWTSEWIVKFQI